MMKKVLFFISCVVLQFGSVSALISELELNACMKKKNPEALDAYNAAWEERQNIIDKFYKNQAVIRYMNLGKAEAAALGLIQDLAIKSADAAYNTAVSKLQTVRDAAYNKASEDFSKDYKKALIKSHQANKLVVKAYNAALNTFNDTKSPLTPLIQQEYRQIYGSCVQEQNPTPYIPKMGFYNVGKHKNI